MEKHLFSITFTLNCFVLLLSFTGVISAPLIDVMKNDTKCNASKFLYDTKYTKLCSSLKYPIDLDFTPNTVNYFLCLGVYDAAYKICQYSSRQTFFNSTLFNSYIDSLVSDGNEEFDEASQQEFCQNLAGLTGLLYNKTNLYLEKLIKKLDKLDKVDKCQKICFDFNNKLEPLCAVLGWIKSIENNMEKPNHDPIAPTQSVDQSHDESFKDTISGTKISKQVDIEEQSRKQTATDFKNNNNKKVKQNMSYNISNTNIKPEEKPINLEGFNKDKTQKTVDNTLINAGTKKSILYDKAGTNKAAQFKNMPANDEVSLKNNVPNNFDVNEGKSENFKKKQNINDVKTTTLSENTQEHYDGNVEDEMETGDMNDADDTVLQSNTGNQNEEIHVQETFEKNNSRFPNLRTEDDSHFFTYFTVIVMMCIIGYIGYCNKQKIFAIVLEGRRSKNNRGRRRPSTASYRKLDCTLEEAVTSQCNANVTHVIY